MKNRIHFSMWLLVVIVLSITIIIFSDTLALFETDAEGDVTSDVGKWIIKVNNETITNAESETINIDSFVYTTNTHVESGYIAPGGTAYFDLTVDASESDVAVLYDIDLNLSDTPYADNISFRLEDSGNTVTRTDEYVYSGIIALNQLTTSRTVRIYVTWNDLPAFNDSDTELGKVAGNKLTIPIKFHAKQYLGETLVAWGVGTRGSTKLGSGRFGNNNTFDVYLDYDLVRTTDNKVLGSMIIRGKMTNPNTNSTGYSANIAGTFSVGNQSWNANEMLVVNSNWHSFNASSTNPFSNGTSITWSFSPSSGSAINNTLMGSVYLN